MILANGPVLPWAIDIASVLLISAMVIAFVRLAKGPSVPDRVVSLDTITVLAVAFSGLFAIASGEAAFLDVAIALALVAFLATVAFARFAERNAAPPNDPSEDREACS